MTVPNAAVGARPGTFFVDRPDGFVWWVTSERDPSGAGYRWARFYGLRGSDWDYATQEEAEKAHLAPLVVDEPTVKAVAYPTAPIPVPESARPAPAPLDPGNPEHLRQVAEFLWEVPAVRYAGSYWLGCSARECEDNADRLDRERDEAEQDASDRKRAEEVAMVAWADGDGYAQWHNAPEQHRADLIAATLAGLRAGRAEAES